MADLIKEQKPTCLEVRIMRASHGYQLDHHQMHIHYFFSKKQNQALKCIFFPFQPEKPKILKRKEYIMNMFSCEIVYSYITDFEILFKHLFLCTYVCASEDSF